MSFRGAQSANPESIATTLPRSAPGRVDDSSHGTGGAAADPLPRAKADEVGLSSERLDRIGQILRADVERGRIPGAVVIVARKDVIELDMSVDEALKYVISMGVVPPNGNGK